MSRVTLISGVYGSEPTTAHRSLRFEPETQGNRCRRSRWRKAACSRAAKRLVLEHENLKRGQFNQFGRCSDATKPKNSADAVVYLTELDETGRTEALRNTGVLLTFNTSKELRPGEAKLLDGAGLIQFMIGGVDFIPLGELPEGVPVATNGGGYAESMAEHALAMALAAAKRLVLEHENLKRGQFNQFARNRMLAGRVCGIFGFGGIGAATALLMQGIGMRVHAINRHGRTDQRVD